MKRDKSTTGKEILHLVQKLPNEGEMAIWVRYGIAPDGGWVEESGMIGVYPNGKDALHETDRLILEKRLISSESEVNEDNEDDFIYRIQGVEGWVHEIYFMPCTRMNLLGRLIDSFLSKDETKDLRVPEAIQSAINRG